MKTEHLETLLLDRALGELSPEVSDLLDTHLAHDPDAVRRAGELAETLQLARTASAIPSTSSCRPLDIERLKRAESAARSVKRRTEIFRLAACLALGLGVGWLAHAPRAHPLVAVAPSSVASTVPEPPAAIPRARFWSLARLASEQEAATASGHRRESGRQLHWNSAAQTPHVEDKL